MQKKIDEIVTDEQVLIEAKLQDISKKIEQSEIIKQNELQKLQEIKSKSLLKIEKKKVNELETQVVVNKQLKKSSCKPFQETENQKDSASSSKQSLINASTQITTSATASTSKSNKGGVVKSTSSKYKPKKHIDEIVTDEQVLIEAKLQDISKKIEQSEIIKQNELQKLQEIKSKSLLKIEKKKVNELETQVVVNKQLKKSSCKPFQETENQKDSASSSKQSLINASTQITTSATASTSKSNKGGVVKSTSSKYKPKKHIDEIVTDEQVLIEAKLQDISKKIEQSEIIKQNELQKLQEIKSKSLLKIEKKKVNELETQVVVNKQLKKSSCKPFQETENQKDSASSSKQSLINASTQITTSATASTSKSNKGGVVKSTSSKYKPKKHIDEIVTDEQVLIEAKLQDISKKIEQSEIIKQNELQKLQEIKSKSLLKIEKKKVNELETQVVVNKQLEKRNDDSFSLPEIPNHELETKKKKKTSSDSYSSEKTNKSKMISL
ncbi:hypothetical protein [Spiroplasma endosymbiont of Zeiraphera isertana]|uniref:hypothetical protein n=1 Tax=Spiroplasma endosymbiont of Zeiraphera isertana TaxID=3066313 RepID=UPI00313C916D